MIVRQGLGQSPSRRTDGRPYDQAETALRVLKILEAPEGGSISCVGGGGGN